MIVTVQHLDFIKRQASAGELRRLLTRDHLLQADPGICCFVFGYSEHGLSVLLERKGRNSWCLPVGGMSVNENAETAACRILLERFQQNESVPVQSGCYSIWNSLLRQQHILITFLSLSEVIECKSNQRWFSCTRLPRLLKHEIRLLNHGRRTLQSKMGEWPIEIALFPRKFTLPKLHFIYESVFGQQLDKRNFKKKVLSLPVLRKLDEYDRHSSKKPARLYTFERASQRVDFNNGSLIFKSIERQMLKRETI